MADGGEADDTAEVVNSGEWKKCIDSVARAVVVLKVTGVRAFDTESAGSSYATGFVVDKARGLILTNRHVVRPGPVVAEAVFLNREEVPVRALYRDPVHDFGFFRFDPGQLQFMDVTEVPLFPEGAAVGLEVRVVGNDSGEKLSILSGTIARLDRDAPQYSKAGYNDENSHYIQAASGTKGGSSGSPVVDIRGRAVGLNAGSKTKSASAFFLPLNRVARALELLKTCHPQHHPELVDAHQQQLKGKQPMQRPAGASAPPSATPAAATSMPPVPWATPEVPRGTIQATFAFKGFDEIRRLGLRRETEARVRAAHRSELIGMLTVESTVPGGPADGKLHTGDVLVQVGDNICTDFIELEEALDSSVGREMRITLDRAGQEVAVSVRVGDFHRVTPDRFLEVWGGVVHALSYQQARNFRAQCGLTYVAEPGYVLGQSSVPKHAIIVSLDKVPTPTVDAFAAALAPLQEGARVPLEYYTFGDRHRIKTALLNVTHRWYDVPKFYARDDSVGLWWATPALPSDPSKQQQPLSASAAAAAALGKASSPKSKASGATNAILDDMLANILIDSSEAATTQGTLTSPKWPAAPKAQLLPDSAEDDEGSRGAKRARTGADAGAPIIARDGAEQNGAGGWYGGTGIRGLLRGVTQHIPLPRALVAGGGGGGASTSLVGAAGEEGVAEVVARSLVLLQVDIAPVALADGVHARTFKGAGLVVAHGGEKGLVLTDRNTAPIATVDVLISFAAHPTEIRGRVIYLHPVHNFALIEYDMALLPRAAADAVTSATLAPSPPLQKGDSVHLIGLSASMRPTSRTSTVTDAHHALNIPPADVPRFRATKEEVAELDIDFGSNFSGVLADNAGRVRALWASYSKQVAKDDDREFVRGIPTEVFAPAVEAAYRAVAARAERRRREQRALQEAQAQPSTSAAAAAAAAAAAMPPPPPKGGRKRGRDGGDEGNGGAAAGGGGSGSSGGQANGGGGATAGSADFDPDTFFSEWVALLDVELEPLLLTKAAGCGLSQEWVERLAAHDPIRRQALRVCGCPEGSPAKGLLKEGDMVLEVAGAVVSCFRDIEAVVAQRAAEAAPALASAASASPSAPSPQQQPPALDVLAWRAGQPLSLRVPLALESTLGTERMVHWAGCQLQETHRAVRELGFVPPEKGVFISRWHHGSPAHRYGLYALHWISEVNGQRTPDLDSFVAAVLPLADGADVRLKTIHLNTKPKVLTMKTDLHYWPTWELRRGRDGEWARVDLE